ncbi:MAG TPA: hypothetical protein VHA33_22905 [Candidatus Angelobacter sp.]|jgi:hypothetical protein|nr:hypothetical protein [Candidatus Angelobacter sp.]
MAIVGLGNMSVDELNSELQRGAKFVVYYYCISLLVVTFRRGSAIHFIRPGESSVSKGWPWTLLTIALGWWGIPFGPIFSIQSIYVNLRGGKDVTHDVVIKIPSAHTVASGS